MKMENNDVNTFLGDSTSLRMKVFFGVFLFCALFQKPIKGGYAKLVTLCCQFRPHQLIQKGGKRLSKNGT
jgi:hypothetical protein